MNRKLTTVILCCAMLALAACGGKKEKQAEEEQNTAAQTTKEEVAVPEKYTPAVHEDGKYYVGIIQQSGNESLTLAAEGFQDHLNELMGDEVVIDYQVADGGRIGIVYCSEEMNSGFQCKLMKSYLGDSGADYGEYTFRDESDMESVITKACEECGTIYLPNDDMLARNMDMVGRISLEKGTKVFGSDENMCKAGALASYGIDYYEMGKRTADIAYDVLVYGIDKPDNYNNEDDEADDYEDRGDISKISIDRMRDTAVAYYNPVIAEKLGWTPDGTYTAIEVEAETSGTQAAPSGEGATETAN